jgi:hypothetical protein
VKRQERIRKRTPSGASTEKPLPRPFTTSTVSFQYEYCFADIQNAIGRCRPSPGWSG